MNRSIYTHIGRIAKQMLGIRDFSLLRKDLHKRIGKLLYHDKYETADLVGIMQDLGLEKGSTVCIHASMKEFYNFKGTATEIIDAILKVIGEEGTLMMPAFPPVACQQDDTYVFDRENDRTEAGYLAETFRKYPGVKRSINVRHSVCAIGKNADYLIRDHHRGHDCWDAMSPYGRLCELGGLVFNLGMPRSYIGTFEHCTESILQHEHPYWKQFFNEKKEYKYYDDQHQVCTYIDYNSDADKRLHEGRVTKYFTFQDWQMLKISNLEVKMLRADRCLKKMLALGRKGITMFYVPSPKKYDFKQE